MAIYIITGNPGSGKTYYSVKMLLDEYYKFNNDIDDYNLKKNKVVITNIDGLQIEHEPLSVMGDNDTEIGRNFTKEYVEKLINERYRGKDIVFFIDEAQFIFDRKFYDKEVFNFFQYHRHYGLDIYLIAQNSYLIPKDLVELSESEVRAIPRKLQLANEFKYKTLVNKQVVDHKMILKKKKIFKIYKSMSKSDKKVKNPLVKYIVIPILLIPLCFWLFQRSFFKNSRAEANNPEIQYMVDEDTGKRIRKQKHVVKEKKYAKIRLGYAIAGSQIYVYHPWENRILPIERLEFPVNITRTKLYLDIIAKIPIDIYRENMEKDEEKS